MTAEAGRNVSLDIVILEREAGSPAGQIVGSENEVVGDWRDIAAREALAERVDLITLENEFVDAPILAWFVERGVPVFPTPRTLGVIQDKLRQKEALAAAGLAVPPFAPVASPSDLSAVGDRLGWPLVLKARHLGYDGHGNATVGSPAEIDSAVRRLAGSRSGENTPLDLYVEGFVPFSQELAVMVVRSRDGSVAAYPVVETIQRDHICHEVIAPARVPTDVAARARALAIAAARAVDAVGVVGVEMFALRDGTVLLNELAPRPHNSGHYTIEACQTSQFANHLRGVLGQPVGPIDLVAPAAAMVNLLGTRTAPANPKGVLDAGAVEGVTVHLYGKREVRPGRKMGHVTALGTSPDEALERARRAARLVEW